MSLSVGGKLLRNPHAQLSQSNLASHSMVTCVCNAALHGGMQKARRKVLELQPSSDSDSQKTNQENDDE